MLYTHVCAWAKSLQSCLTLCDPMDYSLSGFSVRGSLQARILGWVAMPFSKGSSQHRHQTSISYVPRTGRWVLYHQHHLGSQSCILIYINSNYLFPLLISPLTFGLPKNVVQLLFKCLGGFLQYLSVTDFTLNFIVLREFICYCHSILTRSGSLFN